MGSGKRKGASRGPRPSSRDDAAVISALRERHRLDLENLTLTRQPLKTLQLFVFASLLYLKRSLLCVLRNGGWFMGIVILTAAFGFLILIADDQLGKHVQEFLHYFRFGVWWVALGVASSIGLGSGVHTFLFYLGPHIALFTIKATQCGRVDLKAAPYDTIQLERGPSWLEKDCSEFGPPLFPSLPHSLVRVPLSSILPHVQIEAILWGVGTALGELPPYFISRGANAYGSKLDTIEELNAASSEKDGFISGFLKQAKRYLLSRSQHLNFFTILLLASVPNPLFDLAGIMCGQFGVPFWKFFLATLIGKGIIKAHIQMVFIIILCNNQLLELVENKLIWIFGFIPGFSSRLPGLISMLHVVREKYLSAPDLDSSNMKDKQWKLSFSLIWNSIIWLVLLHFFVKMLTTTARTHLKREQDLELTKKLSSSRKFNQIFNHATGGR